jgi:hypothetical protein
MTRNDRLVLVVAVLVAARAELAWALLRLRAEPDFGLYTQGGLGLFPSPLGRALGAAGAPAFALLGAAAAGLAVLFVAQLAAAHGTDPLRAALLFALLPLGWLTAAAGADSLGLAIFLGGLVLVRRGFGRRGVLAISAGVLTHAQLAPFVLVSGVRWSRAALLTVVPIAIVCVVSLLLTPYSGVVVQLGQPAAVGAFLVAFVIGGLLVLAASPTTSSTWLAVGIAAAECGAQHHFQARYFLPAFALACASSVSPACHAVRFFRVTGGRLGRFGVVRQPSRAARSAGGS